MKCIDLKSECINCDMCNVLQLESYYENLRHEDMDVADIQLCEHIISDMVLDEVLKIWKINKREIDKFLKGKYSEELIGKNLELRNCHLGNDTEIYISFQEDYDKQILGLMSIKKPKINYHTIYMIGNNFVDLLGLLEVNGFYITKEEI